MFMTDRSHTNCSEREGEELNSFPLFREETESQVFKCLIRKNMPIFFYLRTERCENAKHCKASAASVQI